MKVRYAALYPLPLQKGRYLCIPFNTDHPSRTVGTGTTMAPPWAQVSPTRDIGIPPPRTVGDPMATVSGGPTQTARQPGPIAGKPPTRTVGQDGAATGPPTWGIPGGVTIGHTCIALKAAAGIPMIGTPLIKTDLD